MPELLAAVKGTPLQAFQGLTGNGAASWSNR